MIESLIAWFVASFLIGPLQAEMAGRLEEARAPAAVAREFADCAAAATPLLIERVAADPWWGVTTGFGVWTGSLRAEALLVDAAPGCNAAIEAARPFLAQG